MTDTFRTAASVLKNFVTGGGIASNVHRDKTHYLRKSEISILGNRKGPRLHDFRHTMATNSLVQMAHRGLDLYTAMPILSACLGHKSLSATEQYVRLTAEMYPELLGNTSRINAFVYRSYNKTDL